MGTVYMVATKSQTIQFCFFMLVFVCICDFGNTLLGPLEGRHFCNHSRRAASPSPSSSPPSASLLTPTDTDDATNPTSPPSQSENLNVALEDPLHSRPPISDLSPSSPSPSTPTPPNCEALLFSSSRSNTVFTREITRLSEVIGDGVEGDLRTSALCATISSAGGDRDGGSDVNACKII